MYLKWARGKTHQKFSYAGKPMEEYPAVWGSVRIATEKLPDLPTSCQITVSPFPLLTGTERFSDKMEKMNNEKVIKNLKTQKPNS